MFWEEISNDGEKEWNIKEDFLMRRNWNERVEKW